MVGKEMRGRTRGWRPMFLLTVYLGVLAAAVTGYLWLTLEHASFIHPQVGLNLYNFLVLGLVTLLAFIAPATSASAISGEKERRTYDLLLVTSASPTGIILGKWLASTIYFVYLAIAALPSIALVFLYGGVPLANPGLALLVALLTALGYGALGIALSAVVKRTQAATIGAVVAVFFLMFVTLVMAAVGASTAQARVGAAALETYRSLGAPWYVYVSPLTALGGVLPAGGLGEVGGVPLLGSLLNELLRQIQVGVYAVDYAYQVGYVYGYPGPYSSVTGTTPITGLAAWPPWARFALSQVGLTVFCLAVAVLAIAPVKPWTAWLAKRKALTINKQARM
jgi:ABC-type transport system involved in multi-copper enzyme maturation permease subunit